MQTISVVTKRCRRNWACSESARRRKVTSLGCAAAALPSAHLRLPGCCTRSSPGAGWASASGSRSFFKRIFLCCWKITQHVTARQQCPKKQPISVKVTTLRKTTEANADIVAPTVFYPRKPPNKQNKNLMDPNQHSELVKKTNRISETNIFDGNSFCGRRTSSSSKTFSEWWSFSNPFKFI